MKKKKEAEALALKGGVSDEDRATLAAQAKIRAKVAVVVDLILGALLALGAVAKALGDSFNPSIPGSLTVLAPLLSSPVVGEQARKGLELIAATSMSEIKYLNIDLARALQLVETLPGMI